MTQRAVLVGVNYIGTSNQLQGCINDVYRVSDILKSVYKFNHSNVVILTDDQNNGSSTYPTKANILNALKTMVNSVQPGDVSVFHYSGHGMLDSSRSQTNMSDPREDDVIIPVDVLNKGYYDRSNEIPSDDLWDIVSVIPKGSFLFSAIDACHSGTEFDLPYNLCIDSQNTNSYNMQKVEQRPETSGSIVVLSGCKDTQTILDAADSTGRPAGALSYAMCDYILHHTNNEINFVDFLSGVRQSIVNNNKNVPNLQEPQLGFGRMIDCGLIFTLLPNGIIPQLSDQDKKNVKEILAKVYEKPIKPLREMQSDIIHHPIVNTNPLPRNYKKPSGGWIYHILLQQQKK